MRFKKSPNLPVAGRTRAWHHHGSHTPTCKMAYHTKQIRRQCIQEVYNQEFDLFIEMANVLVQGL